MRRILLIAFYYPPVETVGSVRPAALAKYLPRFGWEPIVLTPRVQGAYRQSKLVIETEYQDVLEDWKARLRLDRKLGVHEQFGLPLAKKPGAALPHTRLLSFAKYLLTYPDPCKGWIPSALDALHEISRQNLDIAAIVTTSPPISSHLIGRQAKIILGCPWIADFRDLWTQNLGTRSFQHLQVGLERRTLREADVLVTVSEPWASRLQEHHPGKTIYTITNGFDPDDYCSPPPQLTRDFSITYTGQLYRGQRDPTILFEVVRDLIKEGAISSGDVHIRFYGTVEWWLPVLVGKYGLEQVVELNGPTPRKKVMEHQRGSQVLLLLPWSDPRETGHHSAKLFEYFAATRPILAVGGSRGVLTQALEETSAGVHALSKAEVREFLLTSYGEFKRNGRVSYSGNRQAIARYSHPEMARRFAQVLNDAVLTLSPSARVRTAVTARVSTDRERL
jgi:hypothetical protein